MFKGFDIQKYLDKKPPSDGSFTTTQEIKELNKIPINERFVKEKDDIKSSFLKLAKKKDLNISSEDLDKVIDESAKVILKIKKHHNRPRPKALAKKNNIKFDDKELDSMKTPSYPSGHSAQGILIAKLIGDKFPKHAKEFLKLGKDISYSRNVAHAHYKSDSKFGEQLGKDMFEHLKSDSPFKKKATRKVCLPKAKIARMSSAEKQKVIRAKRTAASKGKQVRSSKSFIRDGSTRSKGLRDWVKQDWRQVGNPSKKCGEK